MSDRARGPIGSGAPEDLPLVPLSPSRDLDDRIVLFDPAGQRHIELLGGGVIVYRLIRDGVSESSLLAEIERRFPDEADAVDEARSVVTRLIDEGLIRRDL